MMTIAEIKKLLAQTPPLLADVQGINADLPDVIGDSLETDEAEDIAQLVHIAKLALQCLHRLPTGTPLFGNVHLELLKPCYQVH